MFCKFQLKLSLLLTLLITFSGCENEQETVEIGMQTKIKANQENVQPPSERQSLIFENYLMLKKYKHYPGKTFILFDTVYTSTLGVFPVDSKSIFLPEGATLLDSKSGKNVTESLFLKNRNYFIYRTAIPEKEFKQFIIVDVPGLDSAKIADWYFEDKMENLISQ